MPRIRGGSAAVALNIEFFPKSQELSGDSLGEIHWCNVFALRGLLHFLAMLIDTDQQKCGTLSSAISDNHIGQDLLIGMPDVRCRVSIINCSSNEVFHRIELSLNQFHNKITKVAKTDTFISQQGRKGRSNRSSNALS